MDLPFDLPPEVEVSLDVSPAAWIGERLLPMGRSAGVRVGELIPTGFEAYARVFHPLQDAGSERNVRWSEIAERNGRVVHPEMQLEHLLGDQQIDGASGLYPPEEGRFPHPEAEVLAGALASSAGSKGCWFAIWDGYGSLGDGLTVIRRISGDQRAHERTTAPNASDSAAPQSSSGRSPASRSMEASAATSCSMGRSRLSRGSSSTGRTSLRTSGGPMIARGASRPRSMATPPTSADRPPPSARSSQSRDSRRCLQIRTTGSTCGRIG